MLFYAVFSHSVSSEARRIKNQNVQVKHVMSSQERQSIKGLGIF